MLLLKNDHGEGGETFYGRMADIFGLPGNVVRHPVCYNNSARCKRLWALFCSEFIKKAPTVAEKGPRSREESSVSLFIRDLFVRVFSFPPSRRHSSLPSLLPFRAFFASSVFWLSLLSSVFLSLP